MRDIVREDWLLRAARERIARVCERFAALASDSLWQGGTAARLLATREFRVAAGIAVGAVLLVGLARCGKDPASDTPQTPAAAPAASSPGVKLAPSQLGAIAIGRAGTYPFPVEREAVGSVNFDDDPAIIQANPPCLPRPPPTI